MMVDTANSGADDDSSAKFTISDFYRRNGVSPGADLFVVGNGSLNRCGQHAFLLTALGDETGPLVREVVCVFH